MSEGSHTQKISLRLALRPVPRRWLLLAVMLASLPSSSQDQTQVQAVFPPPLGRHGQILTTGTGTQVASAFSRIQGTTNIGSTNPSPGASLAVTGRTVLGATIDPALAAYSMAITGPGAGIQMESRGGGAGAPSWALFASGVNLNMWQSGAGTVLSFNQSGAIPMCKRMTAAYTYPGVTTCNNAGNGTLGYPFATTAVDGAGNRIPVASCPRAMVPQATVGLGAGGGGGCPIYGLGGQPPNRSGGFVVCCKFN